MFNFKRKAKQIVQAFEPKKDPQVIIAEIHEAFDTAGEKLLNDAKSILAGEYDIEKGQRLKSIGFTAAKKAVEATEIMLSKEEKKKLADLITYYQTYYPNNKFITETEVKKICQKYGLLCGSADKYISDVPEKNLQEIEAFELRNEDKQRRYCGWYEYVSGVGYVSTSKSEGTAYGYINYKNWRDVDLVLVDKSLDFVYIKDGLKICASVKDFDTKYMRIEDGYKLNQNLPDPVVLQPVNGGYLVISKWGLEANDADLQNEKMN